MEIEIVVAVIILLALVFLATVDMAFSHLSDVSLRRISADAELAQKQTSAQFLREIIDNRARFRFALSSVIQILLISFAVLLTIIVLSFTTSRNWLLFFALVIGLAATVILRQIVPRLVVRNNTEKKLLFLLPAVRPIYAIASIIVEPFVTRSNTKEANRLETTASPDAQDDRDDDNDDDFQALMEVGEAEGIIEEDERALIETVVEFGDTRVGEIMTPRTEIVALPIDATVRQARDTIIAEKFSRLPVYRDSIDNIEGLIYVRDLLVSWSEGKEDMPVNEILRDALFVPETKTADELLKSMQSGHVQIAIVIDEYGGVAGLVTVEDLLEEIVGEIEDEDSSQEEIIEIVEAGGGHWDVLGSTEVDKIERLVDLELEDEDYNTIAGLVTSEAGYVPKVGDKLTLRGLDIEIIKADEKRIQLLRLRKAVEDDESDSSSDA
ncbi:MAG: HlyC/CorC family transporter [Pyrinomonadaceae bacterium]|nr:HlyC/CorC family transporter [Acidobacteriota bacterium]MBP7376108.1 HlyC/CorC family transporter [Pyrinomonadaceae bacterium]